MEHICLNDIDQQGNAFNERKLQKIRAKKAAKTVSFSRRTSVTYNTGNGYHITLVSNTKEAEKDILNQIMYLSEKKVKNQQLSMASEIEAFIEKNMEEMHKALEELRASFEEEINSLDGKGLYNVLSGSIW
jgi:hypothetical protein